METQSPPAVPTPGAATTPEDPDPMRSNRRKACDLCFTKKIKCDMLKPDCSNCLLYHAKCRTTIIRRKANPPKVKAADPQTQTQGQSAAVESRLSKIEDQLQQVLGAMAAQQRDVDSSPSFNGSDTRTNYTSGTSQSMMQVSGRDHSNARHSADKPSIFEPVWACVSESPDCNDMRLPAREHMGPIIDHYFANFNSVVPLFSRPAFTRLLNNWDARSNDRAAWAAIQVVIALGLRTPRVGTVDSGFEYVSMANRCMMNAQTVVSELVTRNEDLLGVQVLLGIVMLLQDSKDPTPASVVIGTAVRLAHRLQLQSRDAVFEHSEDEALQRSRVFWIAYTLEKDISLRAKTPSIQLDADIDLPLPPKVSPDGSGLIWTKDGRHHINFLRMRLELAHIQGKVFDLLYSTRSLKTKGTERQERVSRLEDMLDKWYGRVPTAFQIENVAATVNLGDLLQLTKMHHAYLLAEVMTHGLYSHNADWVQRISSVSRVAMRELAIVQDRHTKCLDEQHAPLPSGWAKCVEVSRGCMKLFQHCTPTESLLWQCSCSHFSALIILLANMLLYPSHSRVSADQHCTQKSLTLLDGLVDVIQDAQFTMLRAIITELDEKANKAVEAAQRDAMNEDGVFHELNQANPAIEFFGDVQGLDLLPYDIEVAPLDFMGGEGLDGPFGGFGGVDEPVLERPDLAQAMEMPSYLL